MLEMRSDHCIGSANSKHSSGAVRARIDRYPVSWVFIHINQDNGRSRLMSEKADELLHELFWRSSLRIAVLDKKARIVLTSKAFRDSFPQVITVGEGSFEVINLKNNEISDSFFSRLALLSAGERFSFIANIPFGSAEIEVRIETAGLYSKIDDKPLFLTEWMPDRDNEVAASALEEIEHKYRNLQENLPVGIYRAAEDGLILTANSALIRMMGFDSFEELQNVQLVDIWVDPAQRDRMIINLRRNGALLDYEVELIRKNGEKLIASFDARGTFDEDGKLVYFDTIVQNITQRVRAINELERLARTDCLTGLYNRQYLFKRLQDEMTRAKRYSRPLSVMLIDLDHFKEVNDTYGHLAGDAILVSTVSKRY